MSRRLSDRIRKLCADVVAAENGGGETSLAELKAALREHTEQLRKWAAAKLVATGEQLGDRRSHVERRAASEFEN